MRLVLIPDEGLARGEASTMARRRSEAELPLFMRFSTSRSRRGERLAERDGLAQRSLEILLRGFEPASESGVVEGAADVVGCGFNALFLAEFVNARCAGLLLAVR